MDLPDSYCLLSHLLLHPVDSRGTAGTARLISKRLPSFNKFPKKHLAVATRTYRLYWSIRHPQRPAETLIENRALKTTIAPDNFCTHFPTQTFGREGAWNWNRISSHDLIHLRLVGPVRKCRKVAELQDGHLKDNLRICPKANCAITTEQFHLISFVNIVTNHRHVNDIGLKGACGLAVAHERGA